MRLVGRDKKSYGITDKIRLDEYESFVENTAAAVQGLKLRGKGAVSYINQTYAENRGDSCRDIPQKQFLSDTLLLLEKKTH